MFLSEPKQYVQSHIYPGCHCSCRLVKLTACTWKERLCLLEPEVKEYIERHVDLKLKARNTTLLAWDADEYTEGWIERLREARRKEIDAESAS
jgi:hypothetical protein